MLSRLLSGSGLQGALIDLLLSLPAILLCLMVHEVSHGLMAYALGDRTAKNAGRLNLDPFSHLDPMGFFCMLLLGFGWARPVPVNISNFKNRRYGMALTALAGPLSNFVLAFVCVLAFAPLSIAMQATSSTFVSVLISFLSSTAMLSVGLGVFNLIPIYPLDGSRILDAVLPFDVQRKLHAFISRYQTFIMLGVIFIVWRGGLDRLIFMVTQWIVMLAESFLRLLGF